MFEYIVSIILILLSACFSGLTLAYFTLDISSLRRRAKLGNKNAVKILPIRKEGNRLLTTLLLSNVAVNAILSVYLSQIASGVMAAFLATTLIFIFGEIIPQATFSRHALLVGAKAAPFIKVMIIITYPITWFIVYLLDKLLGNEMPTMYSKKELMEIVSELEDSSYSSLDEDEERIVHGALKFSHVKVRDVMTTKENVVTLEAHQKFDHDAIKIHNEHSFSRYPVYSGNEDNIIGILFAKHLVDEDRDTMIKDMKDAYTEDVLVVSPNNYLDTVLAKMIRRRQHIAIVSTSNGNYRGVISLEDIIEEILQLEIEDEHED